jgi:carbon storage regulator
MLVLARLEGEEIVIDGRIVVTVVRAQNGKARIGITAPRDVPVNRAEIQAAIDATAAASKAAVANAEGVA